MKEFPQQQIDGTREYFELQGFPIENRWIGDLEISYFVLPQELEPHLPDFALRMTTTDPTTNSASGIFGVSDSVPLELRPYWVAHEKIEFTEIGINQIGRCVSAEKKVADLVPDELRDAYLERRITFFTNLVDYFRNRKDEGNYTADDIQEAGATLQHLQSLRK